MFHIIQKYVLVVVLTAAAAAAAVVLLVLVLLLVVVIGVCKKYIFDFVCSNIIFLLQGNTGIP
jgi:hypothetical protein